MPAAGSGGSDETFEPAATAEIDKGGQVKFEDTWALPGGQTEDEVADAADKAAAAAPAEEQKAAANEEPDFAVLDFDLGLDAEPAASALPGRASPNLNPKPPIRLVWKRRPRPRCLVTRIRLA